MVFVRSTIAHAEVTSVDTADAASLPGVVAVYSGDDLGLDPIQGFVMLPPVFSRPVFAKERVRFVGDIVAAVVAETRAQAVDAAEQVIVDYEPLPVVVDAEAALADGAPLLFPEHGSNLAIEFDFGEDPTVFDGAELVVKETFINQRVAAVPMEGNGIIAMSDGEGGLLCHVPTQNPHGLVADFASVSGLSADQVRVIAPAVGGGFGAKAGMYVEFAVAVKAAARARPAGEVDRDALREHGRDDAGARADPARRDGPQA